MKNSFIQHKKIVALGFALAALILCNQNSFAQTNVGINFTGASADASALLDVSATTKGVLIPRMTKTQRDAITSPANSLIIYQTDNTPGYYYNSGTSGSPVWIQLLTGGSGGTGWLTTGNAGTVDGTNFIGTTDDIPFNIRVNNQKAGHIDHTLENTSFGYQAVNSITSGFSNVGIGLSALADNTAGGWNTAVGEQALQTNTTGNQNTAMGLNCLQHNNGDKNTAIGMDALLSNAGGSNNTASGESAMTANTSGDFNTANGFYALSGNTTGSNNTALGRVALSTNTTGSSNTAVGYGADVASNNLTNATAIGANTTVSASNSLILGNSVNVGIGTSSPGSLLEIYNGNAFVKNAATGFLTGMVGAGTSSTGLIFRKDGTRHAGFKWDGVYLTLHEAGADCCNSDNWASPIQTWNVSNGYVGIGTTTPSSMFSVGASSVFQVNSSGAVAAATGVTSSGTITFSGLSSTGIVHNNSSGVLSSSAIVNADITNSTIDLTTKVTGTLPVGNGGTGATTFTSNGVLYGNGSGAVAATAASGAAGQVLQTTSSGGAPTFSSTLALAGALTSSSPSAGIGYATGAGGTVTQTTNKTTGVTINKVCGTITMMNTSIAAGSIVTFTVTNSSVAATDVIYVQHDNTGTTGAYTIDPNTSAAGSFKISIRNNTAGALAEAIVLRFVVIKAVTN